jgi:hypothetical protein
MPRVMGWEMDTDEKPLDPEGRLSAAQREGGAVEIERE